MRHTWMLEPPVSENTKRTVVTPLREECGDIRVIISSYGQSASDKAEAARFNDWKGVDSSESKEQSIPD